MYEYIPQKSNKKAMYLVCLFLIGGGLLLFLSTWLEDVFGFIWVFQLIGIAFCAASIFIFTRYISKSYIYAVTRDGDLTVTEIQGRKRITVCRLSISAISRVESFESADEGRLNALKNEIKNEKRKIYNYCIDIAPSDFCYIFSEEYEDLAVVFQPDKRMLEYLKSNDAKND